MDKHDEEDVDDKEEDDEEDNVDNDLVGGFNPSENWIISPDRGENNKWLKPPPSDDKEEDDFLSFPGMKHLLNLSHSSIHPWFFFTGHVTGHVDPWRVSM